MSLLIVMMLLSLAFVPAIAIAASGPLARGLLVLLPMLLSGIVLATWWTLRFLAIEEDDGDPSCWPRRLQRTQRFPRSALAHAGQRQSGEAAHAPVPPPGKTRSA